MDDEHIRRLVREVRMRVPVDAAELLADKPPEQIERVLSALPADHAASIARRLGGGNRRPRPGTVSGLMQPARGVMRPEQTVAEALDWLRSADEAEAVTYLYVTDAERRLLGVVVIRDLLRAAPDCPLDRVMLHEPFRLRADQPLREAVRSVVHRHYPVYPVCDGEGRLLGVVPGHALFEEQVVEVSAQSGRMVGVSREERVDTPVAEAFRMRHPWLQLNLMTAFVAAMVVGAFEQTIAQVVALAAFLPVLAGQAGNTGCQAQAITLRGLTLGQIDGFPVAALIRKEALLGLLNGALTGLVAGLAMWWFADDSPGRLMLVVLLAMTGACMASGVAGVLVPLGLRRIGADPATASTIFLTTATDVVGMGLMLALATVLVLG